MSEHARVRTSIGRYCLLPLHLVMNPRLGNFAIRLFGYLAAKHADREDDTCYPTRRVMADALGVTRSTIDAALTQLEAVGAITIEQRRHTNGSLRSCLYTVVFDAPARIGLPRKLGKGGSPENQARGVAQKIGQGLPRKSISRREEPESLNQKAREKPRAGFPLARPGTTRRPESRHYRPSSRVNCPHEPRCETVTACRDLILDEGRAARMATG